ncbi:hypothetical protein [Streptomyces sp. NPDC088812]|uniref:hypothetical protein n=1 Tax=Streptomyces sp. NPDC088812 TaxID=3365905 RepID=UPI003820575D
MRGLAVVVAGASAVGVLAAGALYLGRPALYFLTEYGCGDAEDRLSEALADEEILATEPPAGAEREESYRSCDDDDLFVAVGARYETAAAGSGDVVGHYRRAALTDGWQAASVAGCLTKRVGRTTAYLELENPGGGSYHVQIVADREGSPWC